MNSEPDLKWSAVADFAGNLIHDFRNYLYGVGLEATLLSESVTDLESRESVSRIQDHLRETAEILKKLSERFSEPSAELRPITALDLFRMFQEQALHMKLPAIDWHHDLERVSLRVDAASVARAAQELLSNAAEFGNGQSLKISARADTGHIVYEFAEPKTEPVATESWGHAPFISNAKGGYGLGLWHARRLVEASGGKIVHQYDPKKNVLCSTVIFPVTGVPA